MRLSEIIHLCQHIMEEHGNLESYLVHEDYDSADFSMYYLMPEVVIIPKAPDSDESKIVLTFSAGNKFTSFEDDSQSERKPRAQLRLVK